MLREDPGCPDPPIVTMFGSPLIFSAFPAAGDVVRRNWRPRRENKGPRVGIEAEIMPTAGSTTVQMLALFISTGKHRKYVIFKTLDEDSALTGVICSKALVHEVDEDFQPVDADSDHQTT